MKKLLVFLIVCFFLSSVLLFSQKTQEQGSKGTLEWKYEKGKISEMIIWEYAEKSGKAGWGGIVNKNTEIKVVNRKISNQNLDFIDGKNVLVYVKYIQNGEGEGSEYVCKSITIYILPKDNFF